MIRSRLDDPLQSNMLIDRRPEQQPCAWNPLTDDGDALRLAVKLWLEVDICQTGIAIRTPNGIKVLLSEDDESDVTAATRRAIVRAAAEIGKAMP